MIPNYKDIVDLIKKGSTVEAQEKIMELREGALDLQQENFSLKSQLKILEDKLRVRENLEFSDSVYWLYEANDAGDLTDRTGPYCQHCYDDETKLIRLQQVSVNDYDTETGAITNSGKHYYTCFKCKNNYQTSI